MSEGPLENRRTNDPPEEQGRRLYWEGAIILATALAVVLLAFSLTQLPQLSNKQSLTGNAIFVLLINLNIILLLVLVFLVGRNLIKLFYDRQRRLLGSYLRFRLVLAFVAISLFPAILLFVIGVGFLTRSTENWFAAQVERALEGSQAVVNTFYRYVGDEALSYAHDVATKITETGLIDPERRLQLQAFVENKRQETHVGRILVASVSQEIIANATSGELPARERSEPAANVLTRALSREEVRDVRPVGKAEIVSGAVPLFVRGNVVGVVVVEYFIPQSAAQQTAQIISTFREYRHLRILKQPIKTNYIVTMSMVTLVAVFSAIWLGLFLAKKITVPLQQLAAGTREVAQGHWTHRIEGEADDEIGTLVTAFNRMTVELHQSHQELDARRRYMEIILANITAGVVSLDRNGLLTMVNPAAERLLGVEGAEVLGKDYHEVFARGVFAEVRRVVRELLPVLSQGIEEGVGESRGQIKLDRDGHLSSVLITGTRLTDDRDELLGVVCFFEDVTQIIRVERMEAWREVARRIAHEIKNPLTPIQLAAQRLHRRFAPQITANAEVFDECVRSISQEVDAIKKLVNEFSNFAQSSVLVSDGSAWELGLLYPQGQGDPQSRSRQPP